MHQRSLVAVCVFSMAVWLAFGFGARAADPKPVIDHSKLVKAGTVTVEEHEAGIGIADAVWGHGEVQALGQKKRFRITGMGVGAAGGTKISATGNVYNMKDIGLFAGPYNEVSLGVVAGDKSKSTTLWLRNTNDVVMELNGKATGLAVTGGPQGILIQFDE